MAKGTSMRRKRRSRSRSRSRRRSSPGWRGRFSSAARPSAKLRGPGRSSRSCRSGSSKATRPVSWVPMAPASPPSSRSWRGWSRPTAARAPSASVTSPRTRSSHKVSPSTTSSPRPCQAWTKPDQPGRIAQALDRAGFDDGRAEVDTLCLTCWPATSTTLSRGLTTSTAARPSGPRGALSVPSNTMGTASPSIARPEREPGQPGIF
jgi:hypothetical protein